MTAKEILVQLLDATPVPTPGVGIEPLVESAERIAAARAQILAQIVAPLSLAEADRPLLLELEQRDAAWQDALSSAQRTIGHQRCGAAQLRAYAPAL